MYAGKNRTRVELQCRGYYVVANENTRWITL